MVSKTKVTKGVKSIFLLTLALMWTGPLVLVVLTAMKSVDEYAAKDILSLPDGVYPLLVNMRSAWELSGLGSGFKNSTFYASVGALTAIFLASLAAYALTKLKVRGSFGIFMLIYSGTIFPFQLYLIPLFRLYNNFGIYDTRQGMLLFYITICIPFCLFVLRNYFATLPDEVVEAARIDGASPLRVYWSIVLPMSYAPLLVLFVFQFTWIWNDLLFGLMLSKSDEVRPIMGSLMLLSGTFGTGSTPEIMGGALIASIMPVIIFLCLQRYFMSGLKMTTAGE